MCEVEKGSRPILENVPPLSNVRPEDPDYGPEREEFEQLCRGELKLVSSAL